MQILPAPEDSQIFCYITIYDNVEYIIFLVVVGLSLPLAALGLYKFCQLWGSHNKSTSFVYSMLFLWWLSFLASGGCSIFLYHYYDQNVGSEEMSDLSKNQQLLDWINTFIIQLILLYVPYRWCKNINILFNGVQVNHNSRSSQAFVSHSYNGVETKIQPFLLFYIKLRFLYIGIIVAFYVTKSYLLFELSLVVFLIDTVTIIFTLLLGMCSLRTSKTIQDSLDQDQIRRIFNQYLIMVVASLIRAGFSALFTLRVFDGHFMTQQCPSQDEQYKSTVFGAIFTVVIAVFGNFFPVFIILRIYTLEQKPQQMCKSLIQNDVVNNSHPGSSILVQ